MSYWLSSISISYFGLAGNSKEDLQRCHCVCYRCVIYLGDLARYKEQHAVVEGRTADWSVAASYYQQASTIWPAGGNPYNQVLIISCIPQLGCWQECSQGIILRILR